MSKTAPSLEELNAYVDNELSQDRAPTWPGLSPATRRPRARWRC